MEDEEEVDIGRSGVVLSIKESERSKMKKSEEEHVSNAHRSEKNDDDAVLPMQTVHANDNIKVPSGRQAQQIKELADIARKTKQTSKIMNFPPIDHDAAISYVYALSFIAVTYAHVLH